MTSELQQLLWQRKPGHPPGTTPVWGATATEWAQPEETTRSLRHVSPPPVRMAIGNDSHQSEVLKQYCDAFYQWKLPLNCPSSGILKPQNSHIEAISNCLRAPDPHPQGTRTHCNKDTVKHILKILNLHVIKMQN